MIAEVSVPYVYTDLFVPGTALGFKVTPNEPPE